MRRPDDTTARDESPDDPRPVGGPDDPLGDPDELEELGELDEASRRHDVPDDATFEAG